MSKRTCPRCGKPASYRLGELACQGCGLRTPLDPQVALESASARERREAVPLDSSLVRGPAEGTPGQLWRLKAGRAGGLRVSFGNGWPSFAERGAYLACFFCGGVLLQAVTLAHFGYSGVPLHFAIIYMGVLTAGLAFMFSQDAGCLRGIVLLICLAWLIGDGYLLWKCAHAQRWFAGGVSLYNLILAGWLASILWRMTSAPD